MNFMKKFLLPLQNMVRADLFSGSLAVWSVRGEAVHFAPPHPSRAPRGEGRIPFELFLKYTAKIWNRFFLNLKRPRHGGALCGSGLMGHSLTASPFLIASPIMSRLGDLNRFVCPSSSIISGAVPSGGGTSSGSKR